ncbi:Ribosomal-L28e domain-containing protein [Mycena indigotica]|uniref:Ribosomal-L28e domain-containing protein n=1 Tax=Mycena indigotica TaxID=2126181 RepID=A0A8H6VTI9_9AGAR|nr:Ribosomal-L28e domain-containing protein [Mycena indigotica]KAF7291421.1 Ribosomal-L28e domain-containing protein [Mycena indigotica]
MSTDLQWLLLRKNNSFIVKRGAEVGQVFSKEPGNLRNLHSHKFSGLANAKTVAISDSGNGVVVVSRKQKAGPSSVAKATSKDVLRSRTGGRRAAGVVATITVKKAGRPDLRTAALARVSALLAAQKEPKTYSPKASRSKKAKTATAKKAGGDEDMPDLSSIIRILPSWGGATLESGSMQREGGAPQIFSHAQNFTVNGGSFNAVSTSYRLHFSAPEANAEDEDDYRRIRWGDIDLRHLRLRSTPSSDGKLVSYTPKASRSMYAAKIYGSTSDMSVAVYEGDEAQQEWLRAITQHASFHHPGFLQLFAVASRRGIYAAVFHDDLIPPEQMFQETSTLATMYYQSYVAESLGALAHYFATKMGLKYTTSTMFTLWMRRSTRCLTLEIYPAAPARYGPRRHTTYWGGWPDHYILPTHPVAISTQEMIKEWSMNRFTSWVIFEASDREYPQELGPSHSNLELYTVLKRSEGVPPHMDQYTPGPAVVRVPCKLPVGQLEWQAKDRLSRMDGGLEDSAIPVAPTTGWSRLRYPFKIWADQREPGFFVMSIGNNTDAPTSWIAQAPSIFHKLGVSENRNRYTFLKSMLCIVGFKSKPLAENSTGAYLFLCPHWEFLDGHKIRYPAQIAYWSLDPWGNEPVADAVGAGLPELDIRLEVRGYSWKDEVYAAIVEYFSGRGFDPYSLEVAKHLGFKECVVLDNTK